MVCSVAHFSVFSTGSVLNAGSLALDSLLSGVEREKSAIEAQLGLGVSFALMVVASFGLLSPPSVP